MMKNLRHANVVYLKEAKEETWNKKNGEKIPIFCIVFELVHNEFFDFVTTGGPLPEKIARFYFKELLTGMHFLH